MSKESLFGLQDESVYIDAFRLLHPIDLSYIWRVHNSQKRSRMDITLANQNLMIGVTAMKYILKQSSYSNHAMVSLLVDFETIE